MKSFLKVLKRLFTFLEGFRNLLDTFEGGCWETGWKLEEVEFGRRGEEGGKRFSIKERLLWMGKGYSNISWETLFPGLAGLGKFSYFLTWRKICL